MNVLALCAGFGGIELGTQLACPTARTVCYVEIEGYAAALLVKRMQEGNLAEAPIWSDVTTFDGEPWRGSVDVITGGYPCQPFSQIGKQGGTNDPRHIWPSIKRIIEEVEPAACFFENVPGHLHLGFCQVHADLRGLGYEVAAGLFSAEEVGAGHPRNRLFILANRRGERLEGISTDWTEKGTTGRSGGTEVEMATFDFPPKLRDGFRWFGVIEERPDLAPSLTDEQWAIIRQEEAESKLFRMVNGNTHRLDRLRATGNGVVPLACAYALVSLNTAFNAR